MTLKHCRGQLRDGLRVGKIGRALVLSGIIGLLIGSTGGAEQPVLSASEGDSVAVIRKRAEAFLEVVRSEEWNKLAPFVIVSTGKGDAMTRQRMGIPENATPQIVGEKVSDWFRHLYSTIKPGQVISVRIDKQDKNLALVGYRHEDLDGFHMRFVDGEWYYTLE